MSVCNAPRPCTWASSAGPDRWERPRPAPGGGRRPDLPGFTRIRRERPRSSPRWSLLGRIALCPSPGSATRRPPPPSSWSWRRRGTRPGPRPRRSPPRWRARSSSPSAMRWCARAARCTPSAGTRLGGGDGASVRPRHAGGGRRSPPAGGVDFANLDAPLEAADVLVCSDHAEATAAAIRLFDSIEGLRGVDAGGLASAAPIEAFTAVLVRSTSATRSTRRSA